MNEVNRHNDIILQSARLFREKGYPSTSIRDIADTVNINSASLYYHFKNKEEILLEVMLYGVRIVHQKVQEILHTDQDLGLRVRDGLRTHLLISIEYQNFAAVHLQEMRHLSPDAYAKVIAERDAYEKMWEGIIDEAKNTQIIKPDVDTRLLRLHGFGTLNWIVTWYRPNGEYTPEEIIDAFVEHLRNGVFQPEFMK